MNMLKKRSIPFLVTVGFLHTGSAFVHLSSRTSSREVLPLRAEPTVGSTSAFTANENDAKILSDPMFIDEKKALDSRPASALSPEEMIVIAKRFLASSGGVGGDLSMLAPNFTFEAPVVGPLDKQTFADTTGSVDFKAGFPDFTNEFYGFHVDPFEGDRVWYTARGKGKNTGPLLPFVPEPSGTGITIVNPPQVCSITIDHSTGLITKYTIGYVVDRTVGNTGGLGGLYGILYGLGRPLPFPEGKPWQKSVQYDLFQKLGGLLRKLQ